MSSKTYKIEQVYDIASAFIEDKSTTFERAPDYGIGVTVYKLNKRITATLYYEMELCKTSSNSGFISLYRISMGKNINMRTVFNAHALPRMLDFLRKRKFSTLRGKTCPSMAPQSQAYPLVQLHWHNQTSYH